MFTTYKLNKNGPPDKSGAVLQKQLITNMMSNLLTKLNKRLLALATVIMVSMAFSNVATAQCTIEFTGAPCVGTDLDFEVTGLPAGSVNFLWDFGPGGGPSNTQSPTISYTSDGTKNITVTVKNASGVLLCSASKSIYVNKSPVVDFELIVQDSQCFSNNKFCFKNKSTAGEPGAKITEVQWLTGDGGFKFLSSALGDDPLEDWCHSVVDDNGGTFNLTLRVTDDNGCITEKTFSDAFTVYGSLGLDFFTDAPIMCDSTLAKFTNNSKIPVSDVKTWAWDFGDTSALEVDKNWAGTENWYYLDGKFNSQLTVTSIFECSDTFEFKSAAINVKADLDFTNLSAYGPDSTCINAPVFEFKQTPISSDDYQVSLLWTFGDPPTGPQNVNDEDWTVYHNFSTIKPFIVSLNVKVGSVCDKTMIDTVLVFGPQATIETMGAAPPQIIADNEKYQCIITDTVHFVNNSIFFNNDIDVFDWTNEVDPTSALMDLIDPSSANLNDIHVERLWTFGDQYAPQCTTDTENGINVGKNCNFSKDEFPAHWYTPWETIYQDSFFTPNVPLQYAVFDKNTRTCNMQSVDNTQPDLHKSLFYEQIPQCMTVTLELEDVVHPFNCKTSSVVSLPLLAPDARKLKWSGILCTGNDNPNNGVHFKLEDTKPGCGQSNVWVNFDTLQNPKVWVGPNAGLLTPPLSGPMPWMKPPAPSWPTEFVKKYGINDIFDKNTGWVSVGLIIGNGTQMPLDPACLDTFIYDSLFQIIPESAEYNILNDTFAPMDPFDMHFCKGDTVTTAMVYPFQDSISTLTWNWNDGHLTQEFRIRYKENPARPGELMDYILVREIHPDSIDPILIDSIVTRRIITWDTVADVSLVEDILEAAFNSLGFFMREIDPADIALYFNDGTGPGCIDTTGLGQFIKFGIRADSSVVVHFRDTMLGAFDTVHIKEMYVDDGLGGFDTIKAHTQPVARHVYNEANQYIQTLTLRTATVGCEDKKGKVVLVGFHGEISAQNIPVCINTKVNFDQFIRYFSFDPIFDGLYDPTAYWDNPQNAQDGLETMKWDFDSLDDDPGNPPTIFGENGPGQTHAYNQAGEYVVRVALKDSNDCVDTVRTVVYVTDIDAYFGFNDLTPAGGCVNIIQFFDSSTLIDPCPAAGLGACDQIDSFWWDFGDPLSQNNTSRLRNPGHNYERFGTYEIRLIIQSKLGCRDTITKQVTFDGPDPKFDHTTLQICQGEVVTLFNESNNPDTSAKWVWNWGDQSFNSSTYADYPNDTQRHAYTIPGVYCITLSETQTFFLPSGAPYQCKVTYPYGDPICVTVIGRKASDFIVSDDTVCPNDVITFTDQSDTVYTQWDWDFGDGTQGSGKITTHSYSNPGLYNVVLCPQYQDTTPFTPECPTCDSLTILVESIKADFDVDTINKPFFKFTNKSSNAVQYRWTFLNSDQRPDSEVFPLPKIEYFDETPCGKAGANIGALPCTNRGLNFINFQGEFFVCLEATNINGCADTICKLVRQDFFSLIRPYNVFTPDNGDDMNDVFEIEILGEEMYDLAIYNRWGVKVFESTNSENDWNGKVMNTGNECPEGTYFWTLNYRLGGREDATLSGTVTLIRK